MKVCTVSTESLVCEGMYMSRSSDHAVLQTLRAAVSLLVGITYAHNQS